MKRHAMPRVAQFCSSRARGAAAAAALVAVMAGAAQGQANAPLLQSGADLGLELRASEVSTPVVDGARWTFADAHLRFEPPEAAPEANAGKAVDDKASGETKPPAGEGNDDNELAKKLNNPIANLISVPLQFNYDKGYGPKDAGRITLNVQPVIPFSISKDWNLILRTIVPVIWQDAVADGVGSDLGIGDTTQSFFFSPKEDVGGWIIGAGPVALWPTGTDPQLRSENVGLGPTIVALRQHDGWTYGILANHIWSIAHSDDYEAVNSSFLQPFISYTWRTATSLTFNTESTYDWNDEQWTVPLNLMVSQVLRIGKQPISLQLGGRYYAESPHDGPEWGIRFTFTLLFPN